VYSAGYSSVRVGELKQVEAIELHTCICCPKVEARWQWLRRAQHPLERPLLQTDELRNRKVLGHGTTKLGPLVVSEESIRAVTRAGCGSYGFWTVWQDVSPTLTLFLIEAACV